MRTKSIREMEGKGGHQDDESFVRTIKKSIIVIKTMGWK